MDPSLEDTIDLIPEDAPNKVLGLLSSLRDKIKNQTTAIDLKKKLISDQENEKQEVDAKITALELKIRRAKSLKGESTSDMQEKANINQERDNLYVENSKKWVWLISFPLKYNDDLGSWKTELSKLEKSIKANNASKKQEEASLAALNFEMQGAEKISRSLGLELTCTSAQPPHHHQTKSPLSSTLIDPMGFNSQSDMSGGILYK